MFKSFQFVTFKFLFLNKTSNLKNKNLRRKTLKKENSLLKKPTFILLLFSGLFTFSSYSMFITTTIWYVVKGIEMPEYLGLFLISATVPRLIMMVFGGVLSDLFKKTTIMFSANLAQTLILIIICSLVLTENITIVLLIILTLFFGAIDAFFGPVKTAMIPQITNENQTQQANAFFQTADQIAFIIGPIIAGLVMEISTITISYIIATIFVLISTILVFPSLIKESVVEREQSQGPIFELKEGFLYVVKSKFLLTGIIILISMNFLVIGSLYVAIPLVVDLYGGTPINLSLMETSLGIGMVVGSLIIGLVKINKRGQVSILGLLGASLVLIIFSQTTNLNLLLLLVFFIGLAMPIVSIPFFTSAQETTDSKLLGRVMSIVYLAMNGFDPIAYGVIPQLFSIGISIQKILLIFALLALIISIVLMFRAKEYKLK